MVQGKVARVTDKGFGFITQEGESKDIFFHAKEVVSPSFDDLHEGDSVEFEVVEGEKGLNAIKVSKI